jgi:hypothetical protein
MPCCTLPDHSGCPAAQTLEKVASLGIAGVLSIAVAETVFWVLSFPMSEVLYFVSTGEWIDLLTQEGQLKFLAFTVNLDSLILCTAYGRLGAAAHHLHYLCQAARRSPRAASCAARRPHPRSSARCSQAGWGALGGVIAQYRTVLTAAAMTPWMDRVSPLQKQPHGDPAPLT